MTIHTRLRLAASAALCAWASGPDLFAARAAADLLSPQRREEIVDTAEQLARRAPPPPLPADVANPFDPAAFSQPDPNAPRSPAPVAGASAPAQPARAPGDREILETLAERLNPSGTLIFSGKPLLIIDRNRFEVGTRFIVTYNGQDYELELVAIDRTTFTLRFRGEEFTRPIAKSAK